MTKRVAITGGIGCGKSTVVEVFARMGVPCFVADRVAGGYYDGEEVQREVIEIFGEEIMGEDGKIDKKKIAQKVFTNNALMQRLNGIIHPRVMKDFEMFCQKHEGAEYVLFESAIIYEYGLDRYFEKVICVYLDMQERLQRLRIRDGVNDEALRQRMSRQYEAEKVMMKADYVVLNYEGNPRERQVEQIDKWLRQ